MKRNAIGRYHALRLIWANFPTGGDHLAKCDSEHSTVLLVLTVCPSLQLFLTPLPCLPFYGMPCLGLVWKLPQPSCSLTSPHQPSSVHGVNRSVVTAHCHISRQLYCCWLCWWCLVALRCWCCATAVTSVTLNPTALQSPADSWVRSIHHSIVVANCKQCARRRHKWRHKWQWQRASSISV